MSIENNSLASSNNFVIDIEKLPITSPMITSVDIPDTTMGEMILPTKSFDVMMPGSKVDFGKLSFEFLVDAEWNSYKEIYDLMLEFRNPESIATHKDLLGDGVVQILSNNKNPIHKFILTDLYPIALSGFRLANNETNVIVANCQMTFTELLMS